MTSYEEYKQTKERHYESFKRLPSRDLLEVYEEATMLLTDMRHQEADVPLIDRQVIVARHSAAKRVLLERLGY